VRVVDRVVLALGDVGRERLARVAVGPLPCQGRGVIGQAQLGPKLAPLLAPLLDDLGQEGVGAGGVVGRVGKRQDRLVGADGEALDRV